MIIHESHKTKTINEIGTLCVKCGYCACHFPKRLEAECPKRLYPSGGNDLYETPMPDTRT